MKGNSLLTTSTSALQSRLTRCELRRYREKRPHLAEMSVLPTRIPMR